MVPGVLPQAGRSAARPADDGALLAVEDAVRLVGRAWRAVGMYLENNPARGNAIDGAIAAIERLWAHVDVLELRVHETRFFWQDHIVYDDASRGAEALPWILYRDGLRLLRIAPGFERKELVAFLDLLQRVRSVAPDDDDLVTLLWVAGLEHVEYKHVENAITSGLAASYDADNSEAPRGRAAAGAFEAEQGESAETDVPALVRLDDFDATLYFLSPEDVGYLQRELNAEYETDPRHKVVGMLCDITAMPVPRRFRLEALDAIEATSVEALASLDLPVVSRMLTETQSLRASLIGDPELLGKLDGIPARFSEPSVVDQLLQRLDDDRFAPNVADTEMLFANLQGDALEPLLRCLGSEESHGHRALVTRAAVRLAASHTARLAGAFESADPLVVRGALTVAGDVASPATVAALGNCIRHANARVRTDAVNALRAIGTGGALQALEPALRDSEREPRMAAYRAVTSARHTGAASVLRERIRKRDFRGADVNELVALFEAYATAAGDGAVADLSDALNARRLLGPREPVEVRASAARALGGLGTRTAIAALEKAASTKDMIVRTAVARALRGIT